MKSMRMAQCTQAATSKKVLTRKLECETLCTLIKANYKYVAVS